MSWISRSVTDLERIAILNGEIPKNPPELLEKVKVRVLRSFCVSGKPMSEGDLISIESHLADSLRAIGKVEIC